MPESNKLKKWSKTRRSLPPTGSTCKSLSSQRSGTLLPIIVSSVTDFEKPLKVKPLKIPMKSKLLPSGESLDRGVPGQKLRINQPGGGEHKSEIRSILRNNRYFNFNLRQLFCLNSNL